MRILLAILIVLAAWAARGATDRTVFVDPLDAAAPVAAQVARAPLMAVTRAGDRLVAVGARGLVALSDDAGKSWRQAAVPVQSDLVAVQFVNPRAGWITGHDGVVLHTADGGLTWVKQLDGRGFAKLMVDHFSARLATGGADVQRYLVEVQRNFANGPEQPFLGVWFENETDGFVTSAFGMMLATRDGGLTWQSWMERVDNDDLMHLNAVQGIGGQIYIASEKGTIFRLDRAKQRFVALRTGYAGSFFGVVGSGDLVLAHGLRGTVYRSTDRGDTWKKVETGLRAGVTSAGVLDDGRMALATQDGRVEVSGDRGLSFVPVKLDRRTLFAGLVPFNASLVLVGPDGVQQVGVAAY